MHFKADIYYASGFAVILCQIFDLNQILHNYTPLQKHIGKKKGVACRTPDAVLMRIL
jgi:hypothetical protein